MVQLAGVKISIKKLILRASMMLLQKINPKIGKAEVARGGRDVTLVTWAHMLPSKR